MTRMVCIMMLFVACGCQKSAEVEVANVADKVAFDQKSKKAYTVAGDAALPTLNPSNPKSQLLPAWHCEQCQKWYPLPPLEELNRTQGATLCPKTKTPLQPEGPLPTERLELNVEGQE